MLGLITSLDPIFISFGKPEEIEFWPFSTELDLKLKLNDLLRPSSL